MEEQESRIEFERICLLYSNAPKIIAGSGLLTLFFAYFLAGFAQLQDVAVWLLAALLAQVPRIVLAKVFKHGIENEKITWDNVRAHEVRWVVASIPVSLMIAGVLIFPLGGSQLLVLVLFITILCAGNLLNSSISLKSVTVDNSILVVPTIVKLLISPDPYTTTVGVIYLVLIIIFSSYALSFNHTLVENIRFKIDSENLSLFDPLTKLQNRRGMELFVERLLPRSDRTGNPFGIMIIDIDHFKKYNDTYGHAAGDDVLVNVSEVLTQETRRDDLVVRFGGEEFMVILPDTRVDRLQHTAHRICNAVKHKTDVTISAGLACYNGKIQFDELVEKADKALYMAKEKGRDRFVMAS